jgi:hypothetical protein
VDGDKTYAGFGIPEPAPCPSWCAGDHFGSDAGPGRAAIFHGASEIGGAVQAGGTAVSVGMNWIEYFTEGAWQPLRDREVIVFLQAGVQYIAIEATERNMAGLAAVARLISPEVEDLVQQLSRLMEETRSRQSGPAAVR